MGKFVDNFGYSRVIESKCTAPVTAWKLDNSKEIAPNECRIALDVIHIEGDSFQQICSECGFDDTLVKAKIFDILNKRGKLHNPYTKTGGICCGTIEEMGSEYKKYSHFKEWDYVLCQATLTGLPMYIDKIYDIDYNYGQIHVSGYVIAFMQTIFYHMPMALIKPYNLEAFDDAGSIFNIYSHAQKSKNILIIARDLISAQFFASTVRRARKTAKITVVLGQNALGRLKEKQVQDALKKTCDNVFIVDISRPVEAFQKIWNKEKYLYDFTINCEDMRGSEVLCVLATEEGGNVYFVTAKNCYVSAVHVAESMCKSLQTHSFDQYDEAKHEFTVKLLDDMADELKAIDDLYKTVSVKGHYKVNDNKNTVHDNGKAGDFIFGSKASEALVDEVINIAAYDCNVIIQGETGTGKEKVLSLLHKNSERKSMPCVKINCATIQENLAEAEFFGYVEGAFTGAQAGGKKGYFELANGGVLFLDEVGQLSPSLQSKLLRVLQENQFYRVGGVKPINVDVRVVCANNIPLKQLVDEGKFREDLYYRFNICTINVPPLRDRIDDVGVLAKFFMNKYCKSYGVEKEMAPSAYQELLKYSWPGNVRELENTVQRILINTKDYVITGKDVNAILTAGETDNLIMSLREPSISGDHLDFNKSVQEYEKHLVEYALEKEGSTRKAADMLNMTQAQLMRKKKKYEL